MVKPLFDIGCEVAVMDDRGELVTIGKVTHAMWFRDDISSELTVRYKITNRCEWFRESNLKHVKDSKQELTHRFGQIIWQLYSRIQELEASLTDGVTSNSFERAIITTLGVVRELSTLADMVVFKGYDSDTILEPFVERDESMAPDWDDDE